MIASVQTVRFSPANTKLKKLYLNRRLARWLAGGRKIYSFDLLSGWTCPGARECKSHVIETSEGKRIVDGPDTRFRCFSASREVIFAEVYNLRKANFEAVRGKSTEEILYLLRDAFPQNSGIVRIHVAGDFFSTEYFHAWMALAKEHPNVLFYAYTKSLRIVANNAVWIPPNMVLTLSEGGRYDHLIRDLPQFRTARVVLSNSESRRLRLPIDTDDSHAAVPGGRSFALVIHGSQPAGSAASKAYELIRRRKYLATAR
jgi:hypothetical protein